MYICKASFGEEIKGGGVVKSFFFEKIRRPELYLLIQNSKKGAEILFSI